MPKLHSVALFALSGLLIIEPSHAQVRENDATRRKTALVMESCFIPGGWVKVLETNGQQRAERSPSLTAQQNSCIDAMIGENKQAADGTGSIR